MIVFNYCDKTFVQYMKNLIQNDIIQLFNKTRT